MLCSSHTWVTYSSWLKVRSHTQLHIHKHTWVSGMSIAPHRQCHKSGKRILIVVFDGVFATRRTECE
jgi:hypothetical protein